VRSRFVEDDVRIEAHDQWSGEKITIDNAGVTPAGTLSITSDGRSRVLAVARLLIVTDTLDKPGADAAILAAINTYHVTTTYPLSSFVDPKVTAVGCGQANTASGDPAGCDALDVLLPSGTDDQPLSVFVRSGNGRAVIALADAVRALDVHASRGAIDVSVPATKGAVIAIIADTGDDIVLRLPADFATDVITLDTGGPIDTAAFPDVQSGKGRGGAGLGAKSITVQSARTSSVGGRIVLLAR
jgi:hypothetical protein